MGEKAAIDYQALQQCFQQMGIVTHVSEAQGLLAGALCGKTNFSLLNWLELIHTDEGIDLEVLEKSSKEILSAAFELTKSGFQSTEYPLLLPEVNAELSDRTNALGQWCQGFITGLGLSGCFINESAQSHSAELLSDFSEIAKVSANDDEADEQEEAFLEVVNYVRGAAVLMHHSLALNDKADMSTTAH